MYILENHFFKFEKDCINIIDYYYFFTFQILYIDIVQQMSRKLY